MKSRSATKVFTDRGLYMLATILKGDMARDMTFAIIETFAKVRELKIDLLHRNNYIDDKQYNSIYADCEELVKILVFFIYFNNLNKEKIFE